MVEKVRTPLVTNSSGVSKSLGKVERRRSQVRQSIQLRQKSRRGLHRVLRSGITAGKRGSAEVSNALKAVPDAAHKNLAAPDAAVVSVTRAVEAHTQHALVPLAAFGQHGRHMRAMMLHRHRPKGPQLRSVERRSILRMAIMGHAAVHPNQPRTSPPGRRWFPEMREMPRSVPGPQCAG